MHICLLISKVCFLVKLVRQRKIGALSKCNTMTLHVKLCEHASEHDKTCHCGEVEPYNMIEVSSKLLLCSQRRNAFKGQYKMSRGERHPPQWIASPWQSACLPCEPASHRSAQQAASAATCARENEISACLVFWPLEVSEPTA
jgi:hypothetical protein